MKPIALPPLLFSNGNLPVVHSHSSKSFKPAHSTDKSFYAGLTKDVFQPGLSHSSLSAPSAKPASSVAFSYGSIALLTPVPVADLMVQSDFENPHSDLEMQLRVSNIIRSVQARSNGWINQLKRADWQHLATQELSTNLNILPTGSATPPGHVEFHGLYLQKLVGRPNGADLKRDLIISVSDPGVGDKRDDAGKQIHDRCLMYCLDEQNRPMPPFIVSANNGSLGMVAASFDQKNIRYQIVPLNIDALEKFEEKRNGGIPISHIFHGREIFAEMAGIIASGLDFREFLDFERGPEPVKASSFVQAIHSLTSLKVGEQVTIEVIPDKTFENLTTSLMLPMRQKDDFVNQRFEITGGPHGPVDVPIKPGFNHVPHGAPVLYPSSKYGLQGDDYFLELALNMGTAATYFGIKGFNPGKLQIKRIA